MQSETKQGIEAILSVANQMLDAIEVIANHTDFEDDTISGALAGLCNGLRRQHGKLQEMTDSN